MNVHWNASVKKYLIFYHALHCRIDLNIWEKFFDKIIIIRDSSKNLSGKLKHFILRCLSGKYLYPLSKIGRLFTRKWRNDNIFICFADVDAYTLNTIRTLKKNTNNVVCLVEEGDGTYTTLQKPVQQSLCRKLLRKLVGVNDYQYIGQTGLADVWIVRHPEKLSKEKTHSSVVIEQRNLFTNTYSVLDKSFLRSSINCLFSSNKKRLLWISGPVDAFGISETEELTWLSSIAISVKEDYVIYIKRHPREHDQKYKRLSYHCNIKELQIKDLDWVPVEILVQSISPNAIITVSSSAAFHFYEMGIHCKIIYTYRHFKNNSFDTTFLDKYTSYPNIYNIESIAELHHILYETPLFTQINYSQSDSPKDFAFLESLQF